jgi:hypothetical protein
MLISLYQVHRALWLWSKGHITYESCINAKTKGSKNGGGILKSTGADGRVTKRTNFSRDQWENESDKHILDIWACDDDCLALIKAAVQMAKQSIMVEKSKGKRKAAVDAGTEAKRSRRSSYTERVVSDSDYWYVMWAAVFSFLIYSHRTTFLVTHSGHIFCP